MDVDKIIKLVQKLPPEKLKDESSIKKILKEAGKLAGTGFSDQELGNLAKQFTKIASTGSGLGLVGSLMQKGFSKKQLKDIQKKMEK